jgi:hypothetical protein
MTEGYLLELVQCALSNANTQNYLTSNLLKQTQRIATHRKDFINLWWILQELQGNPQGTFRRIDDTMKAKFVKEDYELYGKKYLMKWLEERSINELNPTGDIKKSDQVFPYSIYDIEDRIQTIENHRKSLVNTKGMHTLDVYYTEQNNAANRMFLNLQYEQFQNIVKRIRDRVIDYLIETEMQLMQGNTLSRYFENNKEWVVNKLENIDTNFNDYIKAIDSHMIKGTPIDYEEALLDIRKVLMLYANAICPPQADPVTCSDGKRRVLTEDKYLNRISFVLFEKAGKHTHTELLNQSVEDLVKRIEKVNELSNKGVHNKVTEQEANQCVIIMYIVLGDLIRIGDEEVLPLS